MKTTIKLLLAVTMAAFCCSIGNAQMSYPSSLPAGTLIYSNSFSGLGSVNITNTVPDYSTNILGGSTNVPWLDVGGGGGQTGALFANGAIGTLLGDTWLLPFTPQSGYVYYYSATVHLSANPGSWVVADFAQHFSHFAIASAPPNSSINSYDWTLRNYTGNTEYFGGADGTLPIYNATPAGSVNAGTYTFTQVLDTTSNKWVCTAFFNGIQTGVPTTYATTPSIGAVGIGQHTETAASTYSWTGMTLSASPIVIGQQPASAGVAVNSAFTNTVAVAATSPSFQWYTNGFPIGNATNASLIINPVTTNYAGNDYYVVITNTFGSITSSVASLTVYAAPTFTNQYPVTYTNLFSLFPGANPTYSVSVIGLQPHYQWYTNGAAFIGQTNAAFTWTNVQLGTISNFCVVSNSGGVATSMVWTAQVIADPLNPSSGPAPYPAITMTLHPVGYWRLNEGPDDNNGDQGLPALDYAGGNDGLYTNGYIDNNLGYSPSTDPSDTSPIFTAYASPDSDVYGIAAIDFSAPASTSSTFTIEAWVNGSGTQNASGGGIVSKGYGGGEQFDLDVSTSYRFMVRDAGGNSYAATATYTSDGNWHHLVGVCDEVNGAVSLYVDGHLKNSVTIAAGVGTLATSRQMVIGSRSSTAFTDNDLQFKGSINDVTAFNYALTAAQVAEQYLSVASVAPYFSQAPPASAVVNVGGTLTLPATILGSMPLGYYWTDVNAGTNVAAAVTNALPLNATLTVSNVPANWNNDQLELTVTNATGPNLVTYVSLTVYTNKPVIVSDLPANLQVLPGTSYTYSIGVVGPQPYGYQWYNVVTPVAGQTNSTYTVTAGAAGSSTTYYVVVTNIYGAVSSTVSLLTSVAPPTNTAFAGAILPLNPAGYWPMHEVEPAAPGDIETNYGTLGGLGNAYYPDWAASAGAFTRQAPGALSGDPDTALNFNWNIGTSAQTYTNELYVPHTAPQATLNPPFSVECWLYNTNTTIGGSALNQSVWGQFGWEGLNSGPAGGGVGVVNGLQLAYSTVGIALYVMDNSAGGTIIASTSAGINAWQHVVVTCDANTNFSLYLNGSAVSLTTGTTTNATGKYTADYWTPLTIGGTRGGTRSAIVSVDEFAVYTNAISSGRIATHYTDGTSGGAGVYYGDVTSDNPAIYLRMDAPAYAPPGLGSWPELVNYGTVANPGNYTPGTIPGLVVTGPNNGGTNYLGLSGTNVAALSGVSSFADAGYAAAYNPTGSNANFSVSALFRGNPCDNRVQAIVSHGLNSWELNINTNGFLVFNAGNGNAPSEANGSNPGDVSTTGVYNDGHWHQVVAVNATNVVSIYVDGALATSATPSGITPTSVIPGNTKDVMIGADPSNTNSPAGVGRQFAGQVCEVAFFNSALTSTQVVQLHNYAVNGNPVVINPLPGPIQFVAAGNLLTLSWPTNLGWTLQSQTNPLSVGLSTNWGAVAGSTLTNQMAIPMNPTNGSVFYRLAH